MAQVAVAVANRDGAAVIATGGVELETGELFFAGRRSGILVDLHRGAGPMEQAGVFGDDIEFLAVAVALPWMPWNRWRLALGQALRRDRRAGSARPAVAAL